MTVDPFSEFGKTSSQLRAQQGMLVNLYLNDPETAGNIEASGRKAKYSEKTVRSHLHTLMPKPSEEAAFAEGRTEDIRLFTLAILWGQLCKAVTARKSEQARSDQRVKLNITPDRVLRSLLEIAERAAGYDGIDETGNRKGTFDAANFKPGTAQRGFELVGRDMGMFFDRGPAAAPRTYDQMTMAELDDEITKLETGIADVTKDVADATAPKPKPTAKGTNGASKH